MANVYYVDAAIGNDGNGGLAPSVGNAWATIDKAMNTVVAGDKVWVKASQNYNELATIDTTGTVTSPIVFEGYTSTTGDGGQITINAQSTRANCIADSLTANTRVFYVFKNFIMASGTGDGVTTDINHTIWKNCKFISNAGDGFQGGLAAFQNCQFLDNSGHGCFIDRSTGAFIGCKSYRNGSDGIRGLTGVIFCAFCEFFSNNLVAINAGGVNDAMTIMINCTVDGDSKDTTSALTVSASFRQLVICVNNIIYDCVTGITSPDQGEYSISINNLVNGNTTPYSGFSTFTGEVTSAPSFNNEASNDYRPGTGSPAKNAGYDANNLEGF